MCVCFEIWALNLWWWWWPSFTPPSLHLLPRPQPPVAKETLPSHLWTQPPDADKVSNVHTRSKAFRVTFDDKVGFKGTFCTNASMSVFSCTWQVRRRADTWQTLMQIHVNWYHRASSSSALAGTPAPLCAPNLHAIPKFRFNARWFRWTIKRNKTRRFLCRPRFSSHTHTHTHTHTHIHTHTHTHTWLNTYHLLDLCTEKWESISHISCHSYKIWLLSVRMA